MSEAGDLGGLPDDRSGASSVRAGGAARSSCAGLVDGGPTAQRPSHAGGDRHPADRTATDEHVGARQRLDDQADAGGGRARAAALPRRDAGRGQGVRRSVRAIAFQPAAKGLGVGRRGAGGQALAAEIWGLSASGLSGSRADVWPLNPEGELMLGLKIENRRALENAEASAAVPGLAFAEWGPGDMGMSFGHKDAHDPPYPPEMTAARARVKAACDRAGLAFLDLVRADNVTAQLDDGVRVGAATAGSRGEIGRRHTKRTLPW